MYAIPAKIAQFPPRFDDLDSSIIPPFRFFCEKKDKSKFKNAKNQFIDLELIDRKSSKAKEILRFSKSGYITQIFSCVFLNFAEG